MALPLAVVTWLPEAAHRLSSGGSYPDHTLSGVWRHGAGRCFASVEHTFEGFGSRWGCDGRGRRSGGVRVRSNAEGSRGVMPSGITSSREGGQGGRARGSRRADPYEKERRWLRKAQFVSAGGEARSQAAKGASAVSAVEVTGGVDATRRFRSPGWFVRQGRKLTARASVRVGSDRSEAVSHGGLFGGNQRTGQPERASRNT